jgi:hypothetical protein
MEILPNFVGYHSLLENLVPGGIKGGGGIAL